MIGHRRCCYGRAEAVGFRDPALGPAQKEGAPQGEFGYQARTDELMLLQREALLQRTQLLGPRPSSPRLGTSIPAMLRPTLSRRVRPRGER
jgi:hypothetical protein